MPHLGDYIGQLLSEICMARLQADLETVRLAELYAAHPLLRTMPVPHIRLPEIDLDIPLVVQKSEPPRRNESPRGGLSIHDAAKKFKEVLALRLKESGIALTNEEEKAIEQNLQKRIKSSNLPGEIGGNVRSFVEEVNTSTIDLINKLREKEKPDQPAVPDELRDQIFERSFLEILNLRTPPPRLRVHVTGAEIRELGNADNIVRIRLKVSEESVEWTMIESDGVSHSRLVPE